MRWQHAHSLCARLTPSSLRAHLILLVLGALVPLLLFAVALVVQNATQDRDRLERGFRETTRALAQAVDRAFASSITTLQALAVSRHLDTGELGMFHEQARRVVGTQKDWETVVLSTPAGDARLDVRHPLGAALPPPADRQGFEAATLAGRPIIGNLDRRHAGDGHMFAIHVPVFRNGALTHVLTAVVGVQVLTRILAQQQVPPDWVGVVVDANGIIVARTRAPERFVGQTGSGALSRRLAEAESAFYRDRTVDGFDVYVAFHRAELSGWTVALDVPAHLVEASLARSLLTLAGGGLVVLLAGITLAVVLGRRVARSMAALSAGARALGRGEVPRIDDPAVAEVADVARAIETAAGERRRAEAALRAREQDLSDFFDNSAIGLHWAGPDGLIQRVNQAELDMLGYTREEYVGRPIADVHADPGAAAGILARLRRGETLRNHEARLRARDGTLRDVLIDCNVLWVDGTFAHTRSFTRDVTTRRRVERHLAFLAEASRELAASLDYEQTLQTAGRLAVPALGDFCFFDVLGERGEVTRVASTHVDPARQAAGEDAKHAPPPRPGDRHPLAAVLRTGERVFAPDVGKEPPGAATDPEYLRFLRRLEVRSLMIVPLIGHGGVRGALTLGFAGSGRRHTADDLALAEELARRAAVAVENAQLYRAAQTARAEGEAANRAKDDFLAILSHELRTPLTAMLGWVRMLQSGRLGPEQTRRALETIERNTRVQAQLINDLLDVSRIVADKLQLDTRPVPLAAVIADAVESLRRDADAKGIDLAAAVDDDAGPVLGDSTRLHQIVVNLLSNAVKFTPGGGRVEVRLDREGDDATVTVRDTGIGVHADALPHIFDRFRQADSTISRRHEGLGLGLAIVRHLVELHGGRVTAESPGEGQGATFVVRLPVMAVRADGDERDEPRREAAGGEATRLEGVHILVVEDHADSRELIRTVLEEQRAAVSAAGSVAEALAALKTERFDLLISDLGMPGADGFDLIRWIRARERADGRARLPAVAVTAFASPEDRDRALAEGFDQHVAKPIDPGELVDVAVHAACQAGTQV